MESRVHVCGWARTGAVKAMKWIQLRPRFNLQTANCFHYSLHDPACSTGNDCHFHTSTSGVAKVNELRNEISRTGPSNSSSKRGFDE